jgi:Na+-transporting methylmalonyl-CoA/oxaloacetate decarboxylase gamma subunit
MLNALSIGEKLSTGGITALVGISMTFAVLAILIGSIILLKIGVEKFVTAQKNKLNKETNKEENKEDLAVKEIITDNEEAKEEVKVVDEQTLEAVNTAVSYFMVQNNEVPHLNYKIKSVKRIN